MSRKSFVAASALALAVSCAFAQSESSSAVNSLYQLATLDPVVVSAARVEQSVSAVIPSVSVINREMIERSQARDLPSLLAGEPGFEFARNGGPGGVTSFFLRGADSINLAVFVDGVRAQTDRIGFINVISDIPLGLIERIEIVRGNLGAVHGEAAIGGAIYILTKKPKDQPHASVSLMAGSENTRQLLASYGSSWNGIGLSLDLAALKSDGISARQGVTFNPDRDGYTNKSVNLKLVKQLGDDTEVGAFMTRFAGESEYDDAGVSDAFRLDRTNELYGVFLHGKPTDNLGLKLSISESKLELADFQNGVQKSFLDGGLSEGTQKSLRIEAEYLGYEATKLVAGLEYVKGDFIGRYWAGTGFARSETERETKAGYMGVLAKFLGNDLQLSVRRDEVRAEQRSTALTNTSQTTFLLGAGRWLTDNLKVTAARSTAFRAPTPDEFVSVPTLKTELHATNELGLSLEGSNGELRLVRFFTDSSNAIVYRSDTFDYENVNVENQGWELAARFSLERLQLKFSGTVQDPRNVTVANTRMPRRAKAFGAIEAAYVGEGFDFGGRVFSSGSRKDSNFSNVILSSYTTVDLFGRYRLNKQANLGIRIENLFDEDYQLASTYLTPGRGFFLTLHIAQ
jgi:vitamin B12 transporter